MSGETQLYGARLFLISGSCKHKSSIEHARLIDTACLAAHKSKLQTISIASDGESRHAKALVLLTFKNRLTPLSPIYEMLHVLPLMNLQVGEDDITADKDYKHVFKWLRNLVLRDKGVIVHGVHIKPSIICSHLLSNNVSNLHTNHLLNPNDKQDMKLAYDTLQEIWSLPNALPKASPGFQQSRKLLQILGALFKHLLMLYICIDLSLSEQLSHLGVAAHLLLALWAKDHTSTRLMPTQLYTDIMIMIKNAYFCVAKAKVNDPQGRFWHILLGTD